MTNFKVGYASVNSNPPLGIAMHGYYVPRFAKGFLDDLSASALAISKDGVDILLISVDQCLMKNEICDRYIAAISEATGVLKENIFISSTHTHTGPYLSPDAMFEADEAPILWYADFLEKRLCDVATLSLNERKNAKMAFIVGEAPDRIAYIRRYRMKDGSVMTCPPVGDPNIDHPIGTLDQRVNVLRFDREGADSVVLLNYGIHADTIGGELISSDFVGHLRRTVEKALDGTKCMFFPGAQGDVGSTHVFPEGGDMNDTEISFDNEMKSPGMARFVGRALAGVVLEVYDKAEYVDVDEIRMLHEDVVVPANTPKPEELPLAHKYKDLHDAGRDDEIPFSAMELTTVVAEAVRMCELEHGPEEFHLPMCGVKIGPVALIGIPGEPFTDIGVGIKDTDGWRMILPCALVNGSGGYFPMESAFLEGGYEARSSRYTAGVAECLIQGGKQLLQAL